MLGGLWLSKPQILRQSLPRLKFETLIMADQMAKEDGTFSFFSSEVMRLIRSTAHPRPELGSKANLDF
jgi:hypothetical protein